MGIVDLIGRDILNTFTWAVYMQSYDYERYIRQIRKYIHEHNDWWRFGHFRGLTWGREVS